MFCYWLYRKFPRDELTSKHAGEVDKKTKTNEEKKKKYKISLIISSSNIIITRYMNKNNERMWIVGGPVGVGHFQESHALRPAFSVTIVPIRRDSLDLTHPRRTHLRYQLQYVLQLLLLPLSLILQPLI